MMFAVVGLGSGTTDHALAALAAVPIGLLIGLLIMELPELMAYAWPGEASEGVHSS